MKYFAHIVYAAFMLLLLPTSCSDYSSKYENSKLLNGVSYDFESNPQKSLATLQQVNVSLLSEQDYAYYTLLQARTRNKLGANIASLEESVLSAKQVILKEYRPDKAALACFVMAKVYEAQNKPYKSLYEYLQADDWAEKANFDIPGFAYAQIPYNTALHYLTEKRFDESLSYVEKALKHINNNRLDYTLELHALELKGLDFKGVKKFDSASLYYSKALELAIQNTDTASINRTLYNKNTLIYFTNGYADAEKEYIEQLAYLDPAKDSMCIGATHLALAIIYNKTHKANAALNHAYKAKSFLSEHSTTDMRLGLYETLADAEQKVGNINKSSGYRQQHAMLMAELAKHRKVQEVELAITAERSIQKGETAKQVLQLASNNRNSYQLLLTWLKLIVAGTTCILALLGTVVYQKRKKRLKDNREQCREELLLYLSQQRSIQSFSKDLEQLNDSKQKNNLAETLDNLHIVLKMSPQLDRSYSHLYYKLRETYPTLTADELRIFWLAKTRTLQASEMCDYLGYSPHEFNRLWQSLVIKVKEKNKGKLFRKRSIGILLQSDDRVPISM